jgi:hypothetical protein
MTRSDGVRRVLIEGLEVEDILALPDEHIDALVAVGPVVFSAGSAEILGQIRLHPRSLMVELAQIDGGGEGVLPTLWQLAERFARQRRLDAVEWVVHAINCAQPTSSCAASWRNAALKCGTSRASGLRTTIGMKSTNPADA